MPAAPLSTSAAADTRLPARAWLIVGLLSVVACLNYLDRVMLTTMRESLGVPRELKGTSVAFRYNEWASFEKALDALGTNIAAVVMEPMRSEDPRDNFLQRVAHAVRARGGVFMVDEVSAGWRFGFPGGAARVGVEPDIAVYAKATSNGVPFGAVLGRGEVMDAANASFISSSHWTDGLGAAAALACVSKMQRQGTQAYVWSLGLGLQASLRELAVKHSALNIVISGQPSAPSLAFSLGADSVAVKALYIRRIVAHGFLVSGQYYVLGTHDEAQVASLLSALDEVCTELTALNEAGQLQATAGAVQVSGGFGRLA